MLWLLGALVTVPLFALVYLLAASRESPVLAGTYALASWVFVYGLFDRVLHIPLPAGILLTALGNILNTSGQCSSQRGILRGRSRATHAAGALPARDARLTGTHVGCVVGECGACSVLVDGALVKSCLMLAVQANERDVRRWRGWREHGRLHPIQEAFISNLALQCGFCTPGFLMAAHALLDRNPNPTEEEIRKDLSSNLCMCTGYVQIVAAVKQAASGLQSMEQRKYIGKSARSKEAPRHVAGRGRFVDDHGAAADAARLHLAQPVRTCPDHRRER